jgi:hypothetical protein
MVPGLLKKVLFLNPGKGWYSFLNVIECLQMVRLSVSLTSPGTYPTTSQIIDYGVSDSLRQTR